MKNLVLLVAEFHQAFLNALWGKARNNCMIRAHALMVINTKKGKLQARDVIVTGIHSGE